MTRTADRGHNLTVLVSIQNQNQNQNLCPLCPLWIWQLGALLHPDVSLRRSVNLALKMQRLSSSSSSSSPPTRRPSADPLHSGLMGPTSGIRTPIRRLDCSAERHVYPEFLLKQITKPFRSLHLQHFQRESDPNMEQQQGSGFKSGPFLIQNHSTVEVCRCQNWH